jgi:hypothetical protein
VSSAPGHFLISDIFTILVFIFLAVPKQIWQYKEKCSRTKSKHRCLNYLQRSIGKHLFPKNINPSVKIDKKWTDKTTNDSDNNGSRNQNQDVIVLIVGGNSSKLESGGVPALEDSALKGDQDGED